MNELRPADEYSFFVPWLGFPHESWAWVRGSVLLCGLAFFWYLMLFMLKNVIQNFAASVMFNSLVPMLIDVHNYARYWGVPVIIGLWIWGWECMRTKKYREVIG